MSLYEASLWVIRCGVSGRKDNRLSFKQLLKYWLFFTLLHIRSDDPYEAETKNAEKTSETFLSTPHGVCGCLSV